MNVHAHTFVSAPVYPAHISTFVTADLRFDIAAIKAIAKVRYGFYQTRFATGFEGQSLLRKQAANARRAIGEVWDEARTEMHSIIMDRIPLDLPYTAAERARMAELYRVMGDARIGTLGDREYQAASGEVTEISKAARTRAYLQVVVDARRNGND